jgi:hypothetical protein
VRTTAPRWSAAGSDWSVAWSPTPPHLTGSAAIVAEIEARLSLVETIRPTPTSAPVPSTSSSSVAVYLVLALCGGHFTTSAWVPTSQSVPGRLYGPR